MQSFQNDDTDDKGTKYVGTQPNTISQLYRAFKRYPDCDIKRAEPCKESIKKTQKV